MDDQLEFPEMDPRAYARDSDPDTSHEAAKKVKADVHRKRVLSVFRDAPDERLLPYEVEEILAARDLGVSPSSARSRCRELERAGYLEEGGKIRNRWNNKAMTFKLGPKG